MKQDSHGSNGEVTFNLFPARQKHDWSWAGDEINFAFLLEGLTRAPIRQHVLIEDFSENVAVKANKSCSFLRQGEKLVVLAQCLDTLLCSGDLPSHCSSRLGLDDFHNIPFFCLKKVAVQLAGESACGLTLSQTLSESGAWSHVISLVHLCRKAYDAIFDWSAERHPPVISNSLLSESLERSRKSLYVPSSATFENISDHVYNWRCVFLNLKIDQSPEVLLFEWPEYRAALEAGSFLGTLMSASVNVDRIRSILVPTVGIYLEHLHTKQQEGYQNSDTATHSCNVSFALSSSLSDPSVDLEAVAFLLASAALDLLERG